MRILVVDDDDILRTELAHLLRESGYAVSLAADGPDALERLRLQDIDVVLLDLVMPGRSGLDVLREAHAAHPTTTFIVLTGHGTIDTAVEAMKAGASDFVVKPFEFEALEHSLRVLKGKLRARKELARLVDGAPRTNHLPTGTEVVAALLTYVDGTLIGSRNRADGASCDNDLLASTLDLIQSFMRTAFPVLCGERLRTIVQGRYRILIDPGEWTYLSVVVTGPETQEMWANIHALRETFERENEAILTHWKGDPSEAVGLDRLLGTLIDGLEIRPPAG